jgi:2-polyprenyl-3-methyl-5-hydroxy-6-metoxy-1,4-benzoquinol methylase
MTTEQPVDSATSGFDGLRVLHLQSGAGEQSLALVQGGATVVGMDVSKPSTQHARARALELGVADRARFIEADLYDARHLLPEPESFDVVFTSREASTRLPDPGEWERIVEWFLKPGGRLVYSEDYGAVR